MSEIPLGAVYTAGTATFTLTERGWIWEHPEQPDVHALQPDVKVREYIANGRIWPKGESRRRQIVDLQDAWIALDDEREAWADTIPTDSLLNSGGYEQGFYEGMKYCRDLIQKWDQR